MGRTPLVSPISATSCISEVPGLAKQVSNQSRAGHSASPRDSQASRYLPPVWALVSDSSTLSREKLPAF
jgi:hypothetical protein